MNKRVVATVCAMLVLAAAPTMLLAASGDANAPEAAQPAAGAGYGDIGRGLAVIGICIGAALAVMGGGMAISRIGAMCLESIARQPEAAGQMFAPMIITAAMVEGGMLFTIVLCLLGLLSK